MSFWKNKKYSTEADGVKTDPDNLVPYPKLEQPDVEEIFKVGIDAFNNADLSCTQGNGAPTTDCNAKLNVL